MTDAASSPPPYRPWRPDRANDHERPIYEPPSLAERRQRVRAGFDRAFVDALAMRLGLSTGALREQVGAPRAISGQGGRWVRAGSRRLSSMVIKEPGVTGGTWVLSPVADAVATGTDELLVVQGAPLTRTTRALARAAAGGRREGTVRLRQYHRHRVTRPASGATDTGEAPRVLGAAADQLYERYLLAEHAEAVLGDPTSVPRWFAVPLGALGDTRPLEWLDTAAGRERLVEVLDAIAYGFPS